MYRSVVYTPFEDSADLGVGLSADEVARLDCDADVFGQEIKGVFEPPAP